MYTLTMNNNCSWFSDAGVVGSACPALWLDGTDRNSTSVAYPTSSYGWREYRRSKSAAFWPGHSPSEIINGFKDFVFPKFPNNFIVNRNVSGGGLWNGCTNYCRDDQNLTTRGFSSIFFGNDCTQGDLTTATYYIQPPVTLTVNKSGPNSSTATITSNPGTINCGSTCTNTYRKISANTSNNTRVTLTASYNSAVTKLVSWTGCDAPSGDTCTMVMSSDKTVTANFDRNNPTLIVNKTGSNQGSVTSNPAGINNCTTSCSASFTNGASVILTPTYDNLTTTVTWSGCNATSNNICTVIMNADRSVTASFNRILCSYIQTTGGDVYAGRGINAMCAD